MLPVRHLINPTEVNTTTRADCLSMAREMVDTREIQPMTPGNISAARVIMLQLLIHMTVNTKDLPEGRVNLYSGRVSDGHGVYPDNDTDHPVLDKATGKFYMDPEFGLVNFKTPDGKLRFLVGDIHRVTENFFLASAHNFAHVLHNKLINTGIAKDYMDAKRKNLACLARIFLDIYKDHTTGVYDSGIPNSYDNFKAKIQGSNAVPSFARSAPRGEELPLITNTLESAFGFLRWAHTLVPSHVKINDQLGEVGIFDRDPSIVVDFDWTQLLHNDLAMPAAAQVSPAMTQLHHTGGDPDIRAVTMTRFCEHGLSSWEQIQHLHEHGDLRNYTPSKDSQTPLWLGVLAESVEGRPGPVTESILDCCIYEMLWHDNLLDESVGDHINDDIQSILEFVYS